MWLFQKFTTSQVVNIFSKQKGIRISIQHQSLKGQTIGAQTGSNQYNLVKSQMKDSKIKGLGKINNLVLALVW